MDNSREQNYVILPDSDAINSIPFGYEIELDAPALPTELEDEVEPSISTPYITGTETQLITLPDGTVLANLFVDVESEYDGVELRIVQGEEI